MSLTDEINQLDTAVAGVGTAVHTKETAETTRAEGAESGLQSQITTLTNTVSNIALVRGLFNALQVAATGLNNAVNVLATEMVLKDTSGHVVVLSNVNVTANTGTAGTAGAGANSLDTGNFASNTWYSLWVAYNSTNSTAIALLSLSSVAPALPSGYAFYTRVGWIRTDGTASCKPLAFIQKGPTVRYRVTAGSNLLALPGLASGAAGDTTVPTWVALPWANFAPPTTVELGILIAATGGTCTTMVAPNNAYGAWNSTSNPPPIMWSNEGTYISSVQSLLVESANIFWASNPGAQPPTPGGTGNTGLIFVAGWEDNI
jgi:hypothetical protein